MSRALEGPYEPGPQWRLRIPDPRFAYICKILRCPDGRDVMLTTIGAKSLSRPFPVTYNDDGTLSVGPAVRRK